MWASQSRQALTALPGVPDDQLLVVAHRAEDVRVVIVPGHILPETTFSSEVTHHHVHCASREPGC